MTFYPLTGMVISAQASFLGWLETSQRHMFGAPHGIEFTGRMGVFVCAGEYVVFFRRWSSEGARAMRVLAASSDHVEAFDGTCSLDAAGCADSSGMPVWESTGCSVGTTWATSGTIGVGVGSSDATFAMTITDLSRNPPLPVMDDRWMLGNTLELAELAWWQCRRE